MAATIVSATRKSYNHHQHQHHPMESPNPASALLSYPFLLEALDNPGVAGGNDQQQDGTPSLAHLQEELDSIKKRGRQRKKLREQRKEQRHQPHKLGPDESDYESSSSSADDDDDGDDDSVGAKLNGGATTATNNARPSGGRGAAHHPGDSTDEESFASFADDSSNLSNPGRASSASQQLIMQRMQQQQSKKNNKPNHISNNSMGTTGSAGLNDVNDEAEPKKKPRARSKKPSRNKSGGSMRKQRSTTKKKTVNSTLTDAAATDDDDSTASQDDNSEAKSAKKRSSSKKRLKQKGTTDKQSKRGRSKKRSTIDKKPSSNSSLKSNGNDSTEFKKPSSNTSLMSGSSSEIRKPPSNTSLKSNDTEDTLGDSSSEGRDMKKSQSDDELDFAKDMPAETLQERIERARVMNKVLVAKVKKATKKKNKSKRGRSIPKFSKKGDDVVRVKVVQDGGTAAETKKKKKRGKSNPRLTLSNAPLKKDKETQSSSKEEEDSEPTALDEKPKESIASKRESQPVDIGPIEKSKESKRAMESKIPKYKKSSVGKTKGSDDNRHEEGASTKDDNSKRNGRSAISKVQKSSRTPPIAELSKSVSEENNAMPEPPFGSSPAAGQASHAFKNKKSMFEHQDSDVPYWAKDRNDRSKSPRPGTGGRDKKSSDTKPLKPDVVSPTVREKPKVGRLSIPAALTRSPGSNANSPTSSGTKAKVGKIGIPTALGKNPIDGGNEPATASPSKRTGTAAKKGPWTKSPKDLSSPSTDKESRQSKVDVPVPNLAMSLGFGSPKKTSAQRISANKVNWAKSPIRPSSARTSQQGKIDIPAPSLDSEEAPDARTSDIIRPSIGNTAAAKVALEALLSPPVTKKLTVADLPDGTPRKLKRGFVALNIASPDHSKPAGGKRTPAKRMMDRSSHGKDKAMTFLDSALKLIGNSRKSGEVEDLVEKLEELGGFPKTRRLSMRDNELVSRFVHAIRNRPAIKEVHVDASEFRTVSAFLLTEFIGSLRLNLHVKSLRFSGVELGNDFLYGLGASLESNLVVEEIDLSKNCFTNAGLATFCQDLATSNQTVKRLNLKNQTTPISIASEVDVLDAFKQNRSLIDVQLDFISDDGHEKLAKIMERNKRRKKVVEPIDDRLISLLKYEVERAQELFDEREEEEQALEVAADDWPYLYELAVSFDKHKLKKEVQENAADAFVPATERKNADDLTKEEKKEFLFGEFAKAMEEGVACFNSDGSFLTDEFIAKYFTENPEEDSLEFDFHGQWKLFKRFPVHDPARQVIVRKFVDALVNHPRAGELTHINMANTGCGDDFLTELAERCIKDDSLLPKLHSLNMETNFINEAGVRSLSKLIANPTSCKYMQVIRLENQKGLLKSKGEFALAKAMRVNHSIVVVSLRMRNLLERQQIAKYVVRNVDLLRQARQRHQKATGTQRKRNQVEKFFDKVKDNDKSITEVKMVGNERFLTLTKEEKVKAASSFANNTHVTDLILNGCRIDDDFAQALGISLKTNKTIEKINLESNDISGEGIKALFEGLGENKGVHELRLHKQSKLIATSDEHILADFLDNNTTLTKLGIDLRSKMVQVQLDRKTSLNKNLELKQKAKAKGGDHISDNSYTFVKF